MTDPDPDTERIQAACERLLAAGRDVTFTAVAETSGISRATCYRRRELREIIDRYRSRHGELLTITGLATRLDNLTQVLDAVAAKVRRQEEENPLPETRYPATAPAEPAPRLAGESTKTMSTSRLSRCATESKIRAAISPSASSRKSISR